MRTTHIIIPLLIFLILSSVYSQEGDEEKATKKRKRGERSTKSWQATMDRLKVKYEEEIRGKRISYIEALYETLVQDRETGGRELEKIALEKIFDQYDVLHSLDSHAEDNKLDQTEVENYLFAILEYYGMKYKRGMTRGFIATYDTETEEKKRDDDLDQTEMAVFVEFIFDTWIELLDKRIKEYQQQQEEEKEREALEAAQKAQQEAQQTTDL